MPPADHTWRIVCPYCVGLHTYQLGYAEPCAPDDESVFFHCWTCASRFEVYCRDLCIAAERDVTLMLRYPES